MDLRGEQKDFHPLVGGALLIGAGALFLLTGIREIDTDHTAHRSIIEEIASEVPDLPLTADMDFVLALGGVSVGVGMATTGKRR